MSQRRSALGRGLGALISNPSTRNERTASEAPAGLNTHLSVDTTERNPLPNTAHTGLQEIDIELIDPNPDQPRREFDRGTLEQLARSIGQHGVLQPVVVREAGDRYELVMGERRFRASQIAGRLKVPAVIADVAAADRLELAIVENVQRQDLNPIELALAYQALSEAGHTQEEIGEKVAMDRSSIANHIRLLDLSRPIQADVEAGKLSMGHAKALLGVSDLEVRERLHSRILNDSLSVRATEAAAREIARGGIPSDRPPKSVKAPAAALDADSRAFVERVEGRLQTKVRLLPAAGGGGKVEINYFNLEDLERIGAMLLGEVR